MQQNTLLPSTVEFINNYLLPTLAEFINDDQLYLLRQFLKVDIDGFIKYMNVVLEDLYGDNFYIYDSIYAYRDILDEIVNQPTSTSFTM